MHNSVFLFLNIGTGELMLIFFVALLLFGGEKLPGLARSLGRGIRDFKDASEDVKREINKQINSFDDDRPAKPRQIAETKPAEEEENTTVAEITESNNNHEPENNVDTETEVAANNADDNSADEQPEVKTPDFSRPANTFEYKG